jgi:1,2-diacylglycerol 3-beta-galactosyltransferase
MSVATPRRSIREVMLHGVLGRDGKSCYYYHGRRCGFYAGGRCGEGLAAALGGVGEELAEAAASRKEGRKNVLVLFSDTGGGHRASAEAIRDAFKLEFGGEYRVRVAAQILVLAFCASNCLYMR